MFARSNKALIHRLGRRPIHKSAQVRKETSLGIAYRHGHLSIGAVLLAAGSTSLGTKRYQISVRDLFLLLLIKTRSEKN